MLTDTLISYPTHTITGDVCVPGDKSISHRTLMLGAIAKGITKVEGFLYGNDCLATLNAFKAMGVKIEQASSSLTIYGVGKHGLQKPLAPISCENSGTSMRLLMGLLAAQAFDSELTGDESLLKRPMARVSEPLNTMGACILTHQGFAPIMIKGSQSLKGIRYAMAQASAQVKSALILAGLYAKETTQVLEPFVTRDHTERMLKTFSYPLKTQSGCIEVNARHELIGTHVQIPGDLSSAAFLIVAATITPHSNLFIRRVGVNPTRLGLIHVLKRMGGDITLHNAQFFNGEPVADIQIKASQLHGIDIPKEWVSLAIDEFPAIFIAASVAHGTTRLKGAMELRYKESDRIASMSHGLKQLNVDVFSTSDGLVIEGGALQGGTVDSYHDHRIAMAFLMAGAVAKTPVIVKNCKNIATSFPNFLEKTREINLDIRTFEHEFKSSASHHP